MRLVDAAADLPLRHRMPQATATARRSAVLILFGEGPTGPDVLLIEKSAHLRSHAGQPAFPGGGVDPGDDYPIGTALREAEEEAGIDPDGVRVLATLQELFLPPSDSLVVPVVAWWDDPRDVTRRRSARGGPGGPGAAGRAGRPGQPVPGAATPRATSGRRSRVADMLVWGFTAGLLEAILEAAGLAEPWDERDVRPLPASAVRPVPRCPARSTPAGGGRRRADGRRSRARRPSDAYGSAPMRGRTSCPRWSPLLLVLLAARVLAGCGGDEPAPPAPATDRRRASAR